MSEILEAFAREFDCCFICGDKPRWPALQIHHICRGPDRKRAREAVAALICACEACHSGLLDGMAIVTQLAIKKHCDPAGYDRQQVNVMRSAHNLRGPQPDAITEDEVDEELARLLLNRQPNGYLFPRRTT